MHAADINCIVGELQTILGSRVDKVFQDGTGAVRMRFYGGPSGRAELLIEAGVRVHLTEYRRRGSKTPTSFAMYLRKHLGNRPLTGATQHDFDRIVLLDFGDLRLVVEVFARGNIVLLDADSKVMLSMKKGPKERVSRGSVYSLPSSPISPFQIEDAETLRSSLTRKDLVRSLAVDLGLGRLYANELCQATGLGRELPPAELTDPQAASAMEWLSRLQDLIADPEEPVLYGADQPVEFSPFRLDSMEGTEHATTQSFNQAADLYYGKGEIAELQGEESAAQDKQSDRLNERLEIQRSQLENLHAKGGRSRILGDVTYAHFSEISSILDGAKAAKRPVTEIPELMAGMGLADHYVSYEPATKTLTLNYDGLDTPLDLNRSIGENANAFYEKSKNLERRAEGAKRAIMMTQKELKRARGRAIVVPQTPVIPSRKTEWYEKFRWFLSTQGNLVLSGRDERSNETLVRKHLEDGDIYAHADVQGAPSTIAKPIDGEVAEQTIEEACSMALIHSRIWKSGTTAGDVYWVNAAQVTKRPTSGEYVAKGSFVIRGRRNYKRGMEARCGIGWLQDRFMCGPLRAVQAHCDPVLEILPGEEKKSDVAKGVMGHLRPDDPRADLDQIIQVLPAGKLKFSR
jgi:predicted ribosome quality control (RQC) complex YloA/Tae2 family protein